MFVANLDEFVPKLETGMFQASRVVRLDLVIKRFIRDRADESLSTSRVSYLPSKLGQISPEWDQFGTF